MVSFNMDLFTGIKYVYFHKNTECVVHVFSEKTEGKTWYLFIVIFIAFHTEYTINTVYIFVSGQVNYKMEKE